MTKRISKVEICYSSSWKRHVRIDYSTSGNRFSPRVESTCCSTASRSYSNSLFPTCVTQICPKTATALNKAKEDEG
ncbi:hypothetical protein NPIL_233581 [Nephila pilipes]|uniref:Uncharacterized protein n=1 Tax=Nephila pilipes TaxID=299642 RepID=A0A8X6QND0_NEPPI|nr:hypothetical protein NPIL_233581 [Nephila pilipes]